jgi:hypothetical protein
MGGVRSVGGAHVRVTLVSPAAAVRLLGRLGLAGVATEVAAEAASADSASATAAAVTTREKNFIRSLGG